MWVRDKSFGGRAVFQKKGVGTRRGIDESSRRRGFRNGRNVKWLGLIAIN